MDVSYNRHPETNGTLITRISFSERLSYNKKKRILVNKAIIHNTESEAIDWHSQMVFIKIC